MRTVAPPTGRRCEYVRSSQLADYINAWLERQDRTQEDLAELAGVSRRAISKVLRDERPFQTIWLADRLMCAMDDDVAYLETVWRRPSERT